MKSGIAKLTLITVAFTGAMMTPNLFAYTGLDGTLNFAAPTFQNGNGGEFNAITTPFGSSPILGSFGTFCIEDGEFIDQPPSGPYTYTINSGAVTGGPGADATDPHTGLSMDNISLGTAWLYSHFVAGTLTLDTGTGSYFDANHLNNAGELQQAIWFLEDESPGVNNGYVSLAETALGMSLAQIKANSNGAYGVVVLNLFDSGGGFAQDQLAFDPQLVPAPEPATTAFFFMGLAGLIYFRYLKSRRPQASSVEGSRNRPE